MRNFRSYFGDETVFSFRERSLVAIVGPIGSGKSTVLDGIAFALYGRTPSIGRGTKSLIHQRATDGGVALRFEVGGAIWEVVRSLRRSGAGQHALYRYEDDEADAEPVERIVQEADVNERIIELLGLEFDAFSRSVLLAQGRFAEFLRAPPRARDQVLKGLFGHARIDDMRELARSWARATEIEVEKLTVRVEQLAELEHALEGMRTQRAEARHALEVLEAIAGNVDRLDREGAEVAARLDEAETRTALLGTVAERIPPQEETRDLLARAAATQLHRDERAEQLRLAEAQLERAREALRSLEAGLDRHALERAAALLAEYRSAERRVSELAARVGVIQERRSAAEAACREAEEGALTAQERMAVLAAELAAADQASDAADRRRHDAIHATMAEQLRAGLVAVESCPVCAQSVLIVPAIADVREAAGAEDAATAATEVLAAARAAHAQAGAALQAAEAEARAAAETRDRLNADLSGEEAAVGAAGAELEAALAALQELLGEGDPAAALDSARIRLADAESLVTDSARARERVRADVDDAIAAHHVVTGAISDVRISLADAAARLDVPAETSESLEDLGAALDKLAATWREELDRVGERAASDRARRAEITAELAEIRDGAGVAGPFGEAVAAATERVAVLNEAVVAAEARLGDEAGVRTEAEQQAARLATLTRLASDLTDARFIRYLLDEERTELAEIGSDHFARLSSGRYRFTADGSFDIVDLTAADAVRKPDSLSGGETFLASLGLALGLAEMVARTGGRLDAFFLDEGFGTLDPEHLDLAMEGIEALVADGSGRLVVVVSHLPDLRYRIDDLIVLDRDPMTGDTRVLAE